MEKVHLYPYKDFTDEFINAMKNWDKPDFFLEENFGSEDMRKKNEEKIQKKLVDLKRVTALAIATLHGLEYRMLMKVGSFPETEDCLKYETLIVFENSKKNRTKINWLDNLERKEMVTLRIINGKPWMIRQIFEEKRKKGIN